MERRKNIELLNLVQTVAKEAISNLDINGFIKELEGRLKGMNEEKEYTIDRFENELAVCEDRQTKEFALENTFMTNNGYQQVLIYNNEMVCLEYYKPLPEYDFQLMKYYRTAIFFDLACHDKEDY